LGTPFSRRQIGQENSGGIREIKVHETGKKDLRTHTLKEPTPRQVIGVIIKLSQAGFTGLMGISEGDLQIYQRSGGLRPPSAFSASNLLNKLLARDVGHAKSRFT